MMADDLIGCFFAHDDMIGDAMKTKEIACALNKTNYLAPEAKIEQTKEVEESEEEEDMASINELDLDLDLYAKK
jgi:hypothetical protein